MLTRYLLKRSLLALPVLFGTSLVIFGALRLAPGDPALALAGLTADKEVVDGIRREFGLDRPLPEQYVVWLAHTVRGDLGRSIATNVPVIEEVAGRYPTTIALAVSATLVTTIIGVTLGIVAAINQRRWIDYAVSVLAMALLAIPNYAFGLLLILLFSVYLGVLPSIGSSSPFHFILPIFTAAAGAAAIIARQTRSAVLEVLNEDYVRTARGKGLSPRPMLVRHVLPNALIPVLTSIGTIFGHLISGAVIVETIFGIPGIGQYMILAIGARDYPAVQGAVLFVALSYVLVNILVDFAYVMVDKRIRYT